MEKTGEKYGAARRVLIEQANDREGRTWVSEPETSQEALLAATGRGWDDWCDVIEDWSGHSEGHTAIVRYLQETHGVDGWWAQSVTVGYERITGGRLPYQQPDGTFTAGKSRTVTADGDTLRELLFNDAHRADLFPGWDTALRSKTDSKVVRIAIGPGVAQIAIDPKPDGRIRVAVAHERLPAPEDVESWKAYWADWLEAIDAS